MVPKLGAGHGLQSTNRICNNESRIPNVATGKPNGGRPKKRITTVANDISIGFRSLGAKR
jgi:hypothetical protein